jgi:hypothetical protein
MWPFNKRQPQALQPFTLAEAIAQLGRSGVCLAPGVVLDDILSSLNGDENTPVDKIQLLCVLGGESEVGDAGLLSYDVWHFDAECIEDHGDYGRLVDRFRNLAGADLPITNITDYVDIEEHTAWIEFTIDGKREHWDLTVDNDWMDPALYTRFQRLLSSRSARRFMICALGQDSLVLCGDEARRRAVSEFSGLQFRWE